MQGRFGRAALLAMVIVALAAGYVLFLAPPSVPAEAASTSLTRTELEGPIAPDMAAEDGAEVPPVSPHGQACLPRRENSAGWLQLCWEAFRHPMDSDPAKDYYLLRAYGTYQSAGPLGIRWFVVQATLQGSPFQNVADGWPSGTYHGACEAQLVSLMTVAESPGSEVLCGNTTSGPVADGRGWRSEWTCGPCPVFETSTRGFTLYHVVAVEPGTKPAWELAADFGR